MSDPEAQLSVPTSSSDELNLIHSSTSIDSLSPPSSCYLRPPATTPPYLPATNMASVRNRTISDASALHPCKHLEISSASSMLARGDNSSKGDGVELRSRWYYRKTQFGHVLTPSTTPRPTPRVSPTRDCESTSEAAFQPANTKEQPRYIIIQPSSAPTLAPIASMASDSQLLFTPKKCSSNASIPSSVPPCVSAMLHDSTSTLGGGDNGSQVDIRSRWYYRKTQFGHVLTPSATPRPSPRGSPTRELPLPRPQRFKYPLSAASPTSSLPGASSSSSVRSAKSSCPLRHYSSPTGIAIYLQQQPFESEEEAAPTAIKYLLNEETEEFVTTTANNIMSPAISIASSATPSMQTFRVSKQSGRFGSQVFASQQVDQQNMVFPAVKDFVDYFAENPAKRRYIKKILVATNGIAAVKCILSMRKLLMQLFKEDRIIKFICLTTEQEIQSKAEYLKMADYIVFSPAGANTNNYANVDEIVEHAVRNGVDAVWAGWGHASENPRLPEELSRHNIIFIGPPSKAMFALGDKIASTIIAQSVGIPTIEWSGSGLTVPGPSPDSPEGAEVAISKELYLAACVNSVDEGLAKLREKNITYPIMIKASEGGGGKGIRRCNNDDEFRLNFHRVEAEVPGSPIFLMKCMENARHIEVQLIGDEYGNVIPIFSRDCSIQRRCQKIIEEAPAGIVPEHILRDMQQDAVNLAKKVGYVSAGTVEYMYTPADQRYYFLELNPRLQVEHPCTEMVANINIPAVQLQVAMGIPLHRIVEIRLFFGLDRYGTNPLPDDQIRTDTNICVIAARITSEDPAEGFRPASGSVEVLNFQSNQNVWGYFSVASAGKVHEYADSQFGHLFAKGTTRYEAISALLCALKELELRATFTSQVNYLVGLLHDAEFENNLFHTGWLDQRIASRVQSTAELPRHVSIAIGATVIGHARIQEVFAKFQTALERGQILPKSELTETWEMELVYKGEKYNVLVNRYGPINFMVCLDESEVCTEVRELGNGTLLVTYSDQAYTCHLEEESERFKVCIGRTLTIFEKENDPSALRSRNAGRLLQYLKKDGDYVGVGEVYAEIESMKMVINLEVKKAGGRLVQVAQPGQVLFPGTLIARLEEQGDVSASRPTVFCGRIPEWDRAREQDDAEQKVRLDTRFGNLLQSCRDILNGYSVPETIFQRYAKRLVDELFAMLFNERLPYALFKVMLNMVETRISRISTYDHIKELIRSENNFPARELTDEMESYLATLDPSELGIERNYFDSLLRICERFEDGLEGHAKIIIGELLESFLDTERYFQDVSYDQGVSRIKTDVADTTRVVRMVYAHTRVTAQNTFLRELISRLDQPLMVALQPVLKKLANLFNSEIEPLALHVRQALNKIHQVGYDEACRKLTRKSASVCELVHAFSQSGGESLLKEFVGTTNGDYANFLHEFFFTPNAETNKCAIRLFIQRHFHVAERDIEALPTGSEKSLIFKFEVPTPVYSNRWRYQESGGKPTFSAPTTPTDREEEDVLNGFEVPRAEGHREVFFLSVLSELDTLRQKSLTQVLKKHAERDSSNTFLFVVYPKGENGFSQAIYLPEPELKALGAQLRSELDETLVSSGVSCQGGVDLMLSRPQHPPIYTQYDFAAKEKLELYRLPKDAEDVSVPNSPYLLFKHNDRGVIRLFVRCLLSDMRSTFHPASETNNNNSSAAKHAALRNAKPTELLRQRLVDVLDGACGELRVYSASDRASTKTAVAYDCNHVLLRLDYDPELDTKEWWKATQLALEQCQKYLVKHRVTKVEVIYQQPPTAQSTAKTLNGTKQQRKSSGGNGNRPEMIRLVYMNETGAIPDISTYRVDENDKLQSLVNGNARLSGRSWYAPHQSIVQVHVQKKRYLASKLGTTYVYDYPVMFGRAVLDEWRHLERADPKGFQRLAVRLPHRIQQALENGDDKHFAEACEMLLASEEGEIEVCRDEAEMNSRAEKGNNDRGMVAWEMTLYAPEAPQGRRIVVIANDITFQMGSFSMREHRLYYKASEYSRHHKMPRVYIAANSGARIGFASDVKSRLQVVWNDDEHPEDGFQYLAVQCDGNEVEDGKLLAQIESTPCPRAKNQHRIQAVIGKENDIGVENLVGSGLIAGETSAAYREVPTYCLVTGRAVGIGAYAARLSHRICQVDNSHIILTGAPALNSVLGREIYTSNSQLGGPQIMYRNGVSHSVVTSDLDGVRTLVKWISYLPSATPLALKDDQCRPVLTQPTKSAYDPRTILDPPEGGGLLDAGSMDEIMSGWAKTIIAARGRLCGMPVGVVAVETRTVECDIPADPAAQDSQSRVLYQAGQVWYPDSAYKTAEAINDFNREALPLIVLANIRGFSGGQKDMFEMVLKFGACIVDALQSYTQPIVVYIPPYGELRGGAWAVLDTKINPTCITMLADGECRGGVLEASGIVEIKFRERDLHTLMSKSDAKLRQLEANLAAVTSNGSAAGERERLVEQITQRREKLMPICRNAAVKFADLHDTTARMLAKDAIHDEVAWQEARNYFYRLLQVEGVKLAMARRYLEASKDLSGAQMQIEELTAGYHWVERHLGEMGVRDKKQDMGTASTSSSNKASSSSRVEQNGTSARKTRTRYTYTPESVLSYANSAEFSRVLENMAMERARGQLTRKLTSSHDESAKQAVLGGILASLDPSTKRSMLVEQLKAMDAAERRQLLDVMLKAKS